MKLDDTVMVQFFGELIESYRQQIMVQEEARELIIQKVSEALEKEETKQLIFIDGEAGTGKTVLTSSTFYELYCQVTYYCVRIINIKFLQTIF